MKGSIGTPTIMEKIPKKYKPNPNPQKSGRSNAWVHANKDKCIEFYKEGGWNLVQKHFSKTKFKLLRKSKTIKKMIKQL